jgi:hypothetical protein
MEMEMEIIKNSTGYPCHEVDGKLVELTLEVMNIVSDCEINSEFYGSEREYLDDISSTVAKVVRHDVSSEEQTELCLRIQSLAAAVGYSGRFVDAWLDEEYS